MPASPADALTLTRQYVDQADFYLGIFAFRYGFVPEGQEKSIPEQEYDRAIEPHRPFALHGNPVPDGLGGLERKR